MTFRGVSTFLLFAMCSIASAQPAADDAGFVSIFNGKDLSGWKGLEGFWSVKDGAIVGQATKEASKQTFLVYTGGMVKDFELRLKFKFVSKDGNSGIQFRSKVIDEATSRVGGYQADFDAGNAYTGIIYDEAGVAGGRGIMSKRGMKTHWADGKKPDKEEPLEKNDAQLKEVIKIGDWNDVVLKAEGNHIVYQINGHTTTDLTDEHPKALSEGVLALQMHSGFTQEIHFKDIRLKVITPAASKPASGAGATTKPAASAAPAAVAGAVAAAKDEPVPQWIWRKGKVKDGDVVYFRKSLTLKHAPLKADLIATCDNELEVFVNGQAVGGSKEWQEPLAVDVAKHMGAGHNGIAVRAKNRDGAAAGVLLKLSIDLGDGQRETLVSDANWVVSQTEKPGWNGREFDVGGWAAARPIGEAGTDPWGDIPGLEGKGDLGVATAAEKLRLLPGFKAELLYSVPKARQGSWVCMTFDDKGRIIVSDQSASLYRVTLGGVGGNGGNEPLKVDRLTANIGQAQGLLYHNGSLYVNVNGSAAQGSGFYRVRDTDGDDQFDQVTLLKKFQGGGEHGPHAIVLGPEGKLYLMAGNHTDVPAGLLPTSPLKNYQEDLLLPRQPDANGHATGRMAPGGYILRTDVDGKEFDMFCGGFRNAYDMAFNTDGELFTYDSDMEWDVGTPWYRPTRVNHATSGAEFGWRYGSGVWRTDSADSVGGIDIGVGSPTGVTFGTGAKFPAKYQRALFLLDWAYGTIHAMHLTPAGSSYTGTFEPFIAGRPLPVTDAAIGPDGAMYFTIGGRKTQSGLYRVTYAGNESTEPAAPVVAADAEQQRALRHKLESFHGRADSAAVDAAWEHLDSSDRALRHAARVAIEWQDPSSWAERALAETRPVAATHALIALSRCGDASLQPRIIESLSRIHSTGLGAPQQVELLRAYGLCFIRMGPPDPQTRTRLATQLGAGFPSGDVALNRELCQMLVYLQSPDVVPKAMKLLADAPTQEEQVEYIYQLRTAREGWDPKLRRDYFTWFNTTAPRYMGGNSFKGFIKNIKTDAEKTLSAEERTALADVLKAPPVLSPPVEIKAREFVREWKVADLVPALDKLESGRSFAKGREAFAAVGCATCHKLGNQQADVGLGPDITGVGNRFSPLDILESIIEPSKTVSDLYQTTEIRTANDVLTGRVESDDGKNVVLRTGPLTPAVTVPVSKIKDRRISPISTMPQGLLNNLTEEEILDMLAYLRAAGNPNDVAFLKR